MIDRFRGPDGHRLLRQALLRQQLAGGDAGLADQIATCTTLLSASAGEVLITQQHSDNDLYLLIAGAVSIQVNGREVAIRRAGQHVGEMSLIDPSAPRSATVIAIEETVVARVSEADFATIADRFPAAWRSLALELCDRLRQRSRFLRAPNPRPVLFVGSSTESLLIAQAVQSALAHDDFLVRVWKDRVFEGSHFPIEDLLSQVQASDFALLVLGADDVVSSRGASQEAPRDNVVFELGLFMGALGRERTLILCPAQVNLKIPSDLLGLGVLRYRSGPISELASVVGPACQDLRQRINAMGVQ